MQLNQSEWAAQTSLQIKQATWKRFLEAYRRKFKKQIQADTFVVLASVSLVHPQLQSFKVVSIGQGTKSLPNCLIDEDNRKDLLPDMHAEILALRAFRRFLLEQIKKGNSLYLDWNAKKEKYCLRKGWEVWLYCSQIFCGDCCVNQQEQSFSGAKPLTFLKVQKYADHKFIENVLRTKPGRNDLPISKRSAILSCSDLIGIYNILGIQGRSLFSKMVPLYLTRLIIDSSQALRQRLSKGIDLQSRLQKLLNRSTNLIHRQIFKILIDDKQRQISSQFHHNVPDIVIQQKKQSRNREGFQLCGILTEMDQEWINGKTGLPQGSSIKNYRQKGKISRYSETSLANQFQFYTEDKQTFKYDAILDRIKRLFGEWIEGAAQ